MSISPYVWLYGKFPFVIAFYLEDDQSNDATRGAVSACTAAVKNFQGLLLCRFFLGFLEAPFFPGALFLLSAWYKPKELATRTAILYTGSLLSGGFGGLVGAGVQYGLDGVHGLHAWQWLFILEGAMTVLLSLLSMFFLPDFPSTTKWLSEQEAAVAVHRLQMHSGSQDEERGPILQGISLAVTDYKVWLLAAIMMTKTTAAAVTSFIPTLVATFEYSPVQSLLMVAPPYLFAAIAAMAISISSDRLSERYFHLVVPLVVGMVGYIIAASTTTLAPRYFSLFLMLGGVYGSFNVTYAWMSSTVSPTFLSPYLFLVEFPQPLIASIAVAKAPGKACCSFCLYEHVWQRCPDLFTIHV